MDKAPKVDELGVREWKKVAAEARANGKTVHVGKVFDICVEKNHELPEDDFNRKYKGRVVFEGCFVESLGHVFRSYLMSGNNGRRQDV